MSNKVKRVKVFCYLRSLQADVIFLQETHCATNRQKFWKREWGGRMLFSEGETNARGVITMFDRNLNVEIVEVNKDKNGRVLDIKVKIANQLIRLVIIYGPNQDQPDFFSELLTNLRNAAEDHVVIGGDFNVIIDPKLDRRGGQPTTSKSSELIKTFTEECNYMIYGGLSMKINFNSRGKGANP